jgi:gluconate 2-dehydrogenase gamma chain
MTQQSRRSFLVGSATGLSAAWLASNWSGILDARAYAAQADGGKPADFAFFTSQQAADIDAMASQIIPTDDTPGAHEARCVYFIDCALATFLHEIQPVYIEGLNELQAKTKAMFPDAASFAALNSSQQIQLLTAIEESPFFTAVRTHTVLGMFASPAHGGNYNEVGWKLIGYDDSLNFQPPFGYYDAQSDANPTGD